MKFTKKKKNQTNKTKQKHTHNFFFLQKLITVNIQLKGEL